MTSSYSAYIYNEMPNNYGIAPADLFSGSYFPRHKLKDIHTWEYPLYIVDPTLQQVRKIPKWQPRSRKGIFLGFNFKYGSEVLLVLNPSTGHISHQFHVVFDNVFSTVTYMSNIDHPPPFWNEIDINNFLYKNSLDDDFKATLSDASLVHQEQEKKARAQVRQVQLSDGSQSDPTDSSLALTKTFSTSVSKYDAPITLAEHKKQHDKSESNTMRNIKPRMRAVDSRRGEQRYVYTV